MKPIESIGIERQVIAPALARAKGYRALTYRYDAESEGWMIENLAKDLDSRGVDWIVVPVDDPHNKGQAYMEIWKKSIAKQLKP